MPSETLEEICRLKREVHLDFSVRHFHDLATEKHGIDLELLLSVTRLRGCENDERTPSAADDPDSIDRSRQAGRRTSGRWSAPRTFGQMGRAGKACRESA
jgi:hypothetical protein